MAAMRPFSTVKMWHTMVTCARPSRVMVESCPQAGPAPASVEPPMVHLGLPSIVHLAVEVGATGAGGWNRSLRRCVFQVVGGGLMADPEAFEEFYLGTRLRLLRQLTLMTGDRQQAEDVLQEAYVRAWLRWPKVAR